MPRAAFFVSLIPAFAVGACAGVLGIEDGVPDITPDRADASAGEASVVTVPGPAMPMPDATAMQPPVIDARAPTLDGCVDDAPSTPPESSVFVDPLGSSAADCGTKSAPCATIQLGIDHAKMRVAPHVYVASGTYAETVTLAAGVTVQGGWDNAMGVWRRQCASTRAASVVITGSPALGIGIKADALAVPATLDTLSVSVGLGTSPQAGQSLYGIVATGATTHLDVRDVSVRVGPAGTGAPGLPGSSPGGSGGSCTGLSGNAGAKGAVGVGAGAGSFGPTGYVSTAGSLGTAGKNGVGTPAPDPECGFCVACNAPISSCGPTAFLQRCGIRGLGGCGGFGGGAGQAGQGGGSSIALFAWQATVDVVGGELRAGGGGGGGAGGVGGQPAPGSTGTPGPDAEACGTGCTADFLLNTCTTSIFVNFKGGAAGARGGAGGSGGAGGAGAGGHSYAIYKGSSASVTATGAQLGHGSPGIGGAGAASGNAADTAP